MTYHEDGATLSTSRMPWGKRHRAFGWLEPGHDHARGQCPSEVLGLLEQAAAHPVDQTRGWQMCGFCAPAGYGPTTYRTTSGRELQLGNASLHVVSGSTIWVAPNLVLHYVTEHEYLPPAEIGEALSAG